MVGGQHSSVVPASSDCEFWHRESTALAADCEFWHRESTALAAG